MPELPEVETIARKLSPAITGKRVAAVYLSGKSLRKPIPGDFAARLLNRTIRTLHRRGKYLIVEMKPHAFWLIHLGMSGRLSYSAGIAKRPNHTHATICFDGGGELQYFDPRRFGLMDLYEIPKLEELPEVKQLGLDPLSSTIAGPWLWRELARTRRDIKSFLLDQRRIAGVGNIYASEVLFRVRLHPERRCNTLSQRDASALARAVREVLQAAVDHRGTSFSDFLDSDGAPGEHQDFLQVFQREGEKCRRCRAIIHRLRQGNRSSYYCPRCQEKGPGGTRKGKRIP
jgi:formamidopyrimidine-DNA glycosylase